MNQTKLEMLKLSNLLEENNALRARAEARIFAPPGEKDFDIIEELLIELGELM